MACYFYYKMQWSCLLRLSSSTSPSHPPTNISSNNNSVNIPVFETKPSGKHKRELVKYDGSEAASRKKGWYAISKWFEWFISHKVKIIAEKPETLLFSCFFTRRIWNCHTVVTRATMRSERKWEVNESEIQVMIQLRREWADSRWWCAGTLLYKVEWQL